MKTRNTNAKSAGVARDLAASLGEDETAPENMGDVDGLTGDELRALAPEDRTPPRADRFTWRPADLVFTAPAHINERCTPDDKDLLDTPRASKAMLDEVAQDARELSTLEAGLRRRLGVVMGDTVTGIPKAARWVWGQRRAQKVRNARLEAEVKRLRALLRAAGKGTGR